MNKYELLSIIEENGVMSEKKLSALAGITEQEAKQALDEFEKDGVILGYFALINWEKTERETVHAFIDIKVTPQKDLGFDAIAEKICQYKEVKNVYLMSGGYDLSVMIEGSTMREVAMFVSERISTIDGVTATTTHFVLKKYKGKGIVFDEKNSDERGYTGV